MRFKSSFSLYRRKIGNGKTVFYYRCYDENGRRVCGHSTGHTTKTAAREFCISLLKEGKLIKQKYQKLPTFKEFADGFWDSKTSEYLNHLKSRKKISASYSDIGQSTVNNHLNPKFGALRLSDITEQMIDSWLLSYSSRGLSNATANHSLKFLSIMMSWAVKKGMIQINPCKNVKFLREEVKNRELLDFDDVKKLFGNEWEIYWKKYIHCLINKLAACTGMRLGELIGLKGEFVTEKHILVTGQYNKYGYTDTKNHKSRAIPIPSKVTEELMEFKAINGNGFLFSNDGGMTPISRKSVTDAFSAALCKLGIDKPEQKKRGLSFHSWRHFFNTSLLLADVADVKVQAMTGHKSLEMTRRYTHLKHDDLNEITAIQEKLINF
jgi:integrase